LDAAARISMSVGVATTSPKFATHFKCHDQAGVAMVNFPTAGVDYHVPFGGRKGSSDGPREQGCYHQPLAIVNTTCVRA
jgi:aldehyde dehydrogenase (NAD+)